MQYAHGEGCKDPLYIEYNVIANVSDYESCINLIVEGCTNENYLEYYYASANVDDGSCQELIVYGCTDPAYFEYNEEVNVDDGSCQVYGCTDSIACNFDQM